MPTGVIGSIRSRSNGCSSSSVVAELFFRNATPTACGPALTGHAHLKSLLHFVAGEGRLEIVGLLVLRAAEAREHHALTVERHFEIVGHFEAANDIDRLAIQPRTDHVFAIDRKVMADGDATARADRQSGDVIVLRQIAANAVRLEHGVIFGLATARLLIFQAADR